VTRQAGTIIGLMKGVGWIDVRIALPKFDVVIVCWVDARDDAGEEGICGLSVAEQRATRLGTDITTLTASQHKISWKRCDLAYKTAIKSPSRAEGGIEANRPRSKSCKTVCQSTVRRTRLLESCFISILSHSVRRQRIHTFYAGKGSTERRVLIDTICFRRSPKCGRSIIGVPEPILMHTA
jgi:hypothetical protein